MVVINLVKFSIEKRVVGFLKWCLMVSSNSIFVSFVRKISFVIEKYNR